MTHSISIAKTWDDLGGAKFNSFMVADEILSTYQPQVQIETQEIRKSLNDENQVVNRILQLLVLQKII